MRGKRRGGGRGVRGFVKRRERMGKKGREERGLTGSWIYASLANLFAPCGPHPSLVVVYHIHILHFTVYRK